MCNHVYHQIGPNTNVCILCLERIKIISLQQCCDTPTIRFDVYCFVCINCGIVDAKKILFNDFDTNRNLYHKQNFSYKRLKYFRKKLNLVCCHYPSDPSLEQYLIKIKGLVDIENPYKILVLLKKHKAKRFFKNFYEIYYRLFDKKIINITREEKKKIECLFLKFEKILKINQIKYMNNYNEILRQLMKKLEIQGSEFIIKPKTCSKNMQLYKSIINSIVI